MDLRTFGRQRLVTSTMAPDATTVAAPTRAECMLCLAALLLAVLARLGPVLPQDPHFHDFADQRTLWGIPMALDVFSNLPFLVFGGWGLWRVARWPGLPGQAGPRAMVGLFFAGLVLTACGSSAYHWRPDDTGLLGDRLGMVVAFAGVAGLAVDSRISARAGRWTAGVMAAAGVLGAWICWQSGNLLPWAVLQGGGMLLVLWLACVPSRPGAWPAPLAGLIAWYGLAKLLELADAPLFAWTQELVSGHSLKHVAAACAAWPVLRGWKRPVG